ncbi:AMP-binding protein [Marinobacter sp. F3R11]|uniref:AMP-binding protein n=1 Tax=Marinobacter sp. F3R11 TaxID=2267231 RepID=UPI000DEA0AE6|nr:AMP-binding protein [Marinobacter sp. F3R11]RBW51218.1 hypothetical protein DS878_03660 [Marinobacter sp. F3R11]
MSARIETAGETLAGFLADEGADAPLFILPGNKVFTYGELSRNSAQVAAVLHSYGIGRGDTIAVYLGNQPEWMVAAFAAWRIGAAVLALNPRLGEKEVSDLIGRTGAKALFLAPGYRNGDLAKTIRKVSAKSSSTIKLVVSCDDESAEGLVSGADAISIAALPECEPAGLLAHPEDPCLYIATSGTTSLPKIVSHRQDRVVRHSRNVSQAMGLDADSRVLLAVPLCGGFGFSIAMMAIASGIPLVMLDAFDPVEVSGVINEAGVTHALGTNDMLDSLLKVVSGERPFPGLRMYGHANFTPGLTELPEIAERHGVHMRAMYGLSESLALVAMRAADDPLEVRAEAGGTLTTPGARLRIADPISGEELAEGQSGEIQILSPNVMTGYLNDPERTAGAFTEDGYLRTGDMGVRGPNDTFTLLTRINDVLRIGGYLVAPEEIEVVISADPDVDSCQVVAVTLPQGPRPVAFVVPATGRTPDTAALIEKCRDQLAVYKVPVHIFIIDEVPMVDGPNGLKVKKSALRDMAEKQLVTEGE